MQIRQSVVAYTRVVCSNVKVDVHLAPMNNHQEMSAGNIEMSSGNSRQLLLRVAQFSRITPRMTGRGHSLAAGMRHNLVGRGYSPASTV
jgi:hypothetical protein